jgi:hypothetical protein
MDNRQHAGKDFKQSKTNIFQRAFNRIFGIKEPEKPTEKPIYKFHKHVKPGGAFGKPRWMRSARIIAEKCQ